MLSRRFAALSATLFFAATLALSGCAAHSRSHGRSGSLAGLASPVSSLAEMKTYRALRSSSEARDSNLDFRRLEPHRTHILADLRGPGEITHIWMTIASPDPHHFRNLVLRIYYDGNDYPSVESPVGDFFGLGHAKAYIFNNLVQAVGSDRGMNCFWPMPFRKSARVEVTNDGEIATDALYYYVDWREYKTLPPNLGYFHAQYRQAFPCPDKQPYTILETEGGPGHFVGSNLSVHTQVGGWWGEGDDVFTVDGEAYPSLWGTGSEDYFCGAWCYGQTFYNDYFGMPYRERIDHNADNYWNVYRLHIENPVPFEKSLRMQIEHGASGFDNTRSGGYNNDYTSVAYWYMKNPTRLIGDLAPVENRMSSYRPRVAPEGILEPQDFDFTVTPTEGVVCNPQDLGVFTSEGRGKWCLNEHLFCSPNVDGSLFAGTFEVENTREGPLVFLFTQAPDYGNFTVAIDGQTVVPNFNGYHEGVRSVLVKAGDFRLAQGKHTITVKTIGKDQRSAGYRWGFDYFRVGGKALDFEDGTPVVSGGDSRP